MRWPSPSDQPDLGQVTGVVTLDGKPLSGVAIVFQPENGRPARGKTDPNGKYELTYIRQTKGTKIGPNRVEIAPSEEGENEVTDQAESSDKESAPNPTRSKPSKPLVPARYNVQTELKVEVKAGPNIFDFTLKS
ncbi:MAG: carboxypeptidase regulatory-like domain-containing protein [Pirellulales bacterium]